MNISTVTNFLGITNTKQQPAYAAPTPPEALEKEPKKVLFAWEATPKGAKTISKKTARALIIIGVIVALVFAVMQEFLLIIALASLVFIKYILTAAPQETIKYEISNHGVTVAGQFYGWYALKYFFFTRKDGVTTLCADTKEALPGRLYLTLNGNNSDEMRPVLEQYLAYLEAEPKTFIDKAYDSITGKFAI